MLPLLPAITFSWRHAHIDGAVGLDPPLTFAHNSVDRGPASKRHVAAKAHRKQLTLLEHPTADKCAARLRHYHVHFNALFVHVPKTGGTSIEEVLGLTGSCHCTARAFRAADPEAFRRLPKFAAVRHPLSRLVSLYEYARDGGNGSPEDRAMFAAALEGAPPPAWRFGAFVANLTAMGQRHDGLRFFLRPQAYFLTDDAILPQRAANASASGAPIAVQGAAREGARLLVDHLLSIDDIQREWPLLRQDLPGLPPFGRQAEHYRRRSTANHTRWCEYYQAEPALQEAVHRHYRVDFDLLRFDHPLPIERICASAS